MNRVVWDGVKFPVEIIVSDQFCVLVNIKKTLKVSGTIRIYTIYICPVYIERGRERERGERRECHFRVKLSLLRLVHSLINTDNETLSAA